MAKDYNIKLSDYEFLLHLLESNNDGSKLINTDISLLKYFIKRVRHNFDVPTSDESVDLYTSVIDDLQGIQKASRVISILEDYPTFFHIEYDTVPEYKSIVIPDKKAVDIAYRFFRSQNETYYSNFLDVYDTLSDHLKFIKPNKNTAGETHFIQTTGDAFIYVPNYSNISKVTILIHEIQHVMDALENAGFWYQPFIKETAAMFMELISTDYVANELHMQSEAVKRKAEIHHIVSGDRSLLLDKKEMFDSLVGKKISADNFLQELSNTGYTDEEVKSILYNSTDLLIGYQLPQYIAIELYYLYQTNKSKALEILLNIVRYGNDANIFDILGVYGIHVGSHLTSYESELGKKLQIKRS